MKPTKPDADLAAWCAALASTEKPETVPPEWKTTAEIGAMLGLSRCNASRRIHNAVAAGRCDVKRFRVQSGQRSIYPVPHYRLK